MTPLRSPAQEPVDEGDERGRDDGGLVGAAKKARPREIFARQKMDELGVSGEVAVDEIEELHHPLKGVDLLLIDGELQLFPAKVADDLLEHAEIKTVLVAEVVAEHARVGVRRPPDGLHAVAAVSLGRELGDGAFEDTRAGPVCITLDPVAAPASHARARGACGLHLRQGQEARGFEPQRAAARGPP